MPRYDGMVFNRGAFLAALGSDWSVDIKRVRSVGTCCCGGQGLFMNTLHGSDLARPGDEFIGKNSRKTTIFIYFPCNLG